jgi:hypothetical protein
MTNNLLDNVKIILLKTPNSRDSDMRLCYYIWRDFENTNTNEIMATKLLEMLDKRQISSIESIGRARRKIQEDFPETRGNNYIKRHNNQKHIKQVLGYGG